MLKKNCSVIVLAAGNSSRMGYPKLLLKNADGTSFIEGLCDRYDEFGCAEIIIVLNKKGITLLKNNYLKLPIRTKIVLNEHPELGRFYSIKKGINQVSDSNVYIHNIDNPFANSMVLEKLYHARHDADVIKAVINNKGGHPVLISKHVCEAIKSQIDNDIYLNTFLTHFSNKKVAVTDKTILVNLNTYEEYLEFYKQQTQ